MHASFVAHSPMRRSGTKRPRALWLDATPVARLWLAAMSGAPRAPDYRQVRHSRYQRETQKPILGLESPGVLRRNPGSHFGIQFSGGAPCPVRIAQ